MVADKHFTKLIIAVMLVAVLVCLLAIGNADKLNERFGGSGVKMQYESRLFDTDELMSVNIIMDEETWNDMLANAINEEYYVCDVVINGERINNVAIRPKGNTSLSSIANDPTTDRYSLKLEFDHFVKGQTCFGLDKLLLNNNYADATNMKEAIIYDMFNYIGANASLYNYAKVSVNGEYWGVYLALEAVEDSFMLRNFGTEDGELYKPDTMEFNNGGGGNNGFPGGGNGGERPSRGDRSEDGNTSGSAIENMPSFDKNSTDSGISNRPDMGNFNPGDFAGGGGFGGFGNSGGANLNYIDDDVDSYSTIWDGSITKTGEKDHKRVVTAIKNIHEGTDLEKYLNVDNILRYMAVHVFSVNQDSLSGNMSHNYYLYEYDGQLDIFPWDYNLALGGMGMGGSDAASTINDAIDTPWNGTKFFDSTLANEQYLARYHEYLKQLVDDYVNGGQFDATYNRIRSQIDELVATDPTAFFTYEEYDKACDTLYETVKLRAESIDGQVNGTIPSTDAGQKADSSNLVDASHINLKDMGSMGGGGFGGGEMPSGDMPDFSNGERPEPPAGFSFENMQWDENFSFEGGKNRPNSFPSGARRPGEEDSSRSINAKLGTVKTYGLCLVLMVGALLIISRIKRK